MTTHAYARRVGDALKAQFEQIGLLPTLVRLPAEGDACERQTTGRGRWHEGG